MSVAPRGGASLGLDLIWLARAYLLLQPEEGYLQTSPPAASRGGRSEVLPAESAHVPPPNRRLARVHTHTHTQEPARRPRNQ